MFILSNLLISLAKIVQLVLPVLYWLILIRALISWVNPDPLNPIVQFLYRVTEPILEPIRRRLPVMAIDISPIIAFLVIYFLNSFLVATLFDIGFRIR
jgi:YggT family protein